MGYDSEVITKTVERYIKSIAVERDGATITLVEGRGQLSDPSDVNQAGSQYHHCEFSEAFTVGFPQIVAAGVDPKELMTLDAQLEALAQKVVAWCKVQRELPPPDPAP